MSEMQCLTNRELEQMIRSLKNRNKQFENLVMDMAYQLQKFVRCSTCVNNKEACEVSNAIGIFVQETCLLNARQW